MDKDQVELLKKDFFDEDGNLIDIPNILNCHIDDLKTNRHDLQQKLKNEINGNHNELIYSKILKILYSPYKVSLYIESYHKNSSIVSFHKLKAEYTKLKQKLTSSKDSFDWSLFKADQLQNYLYFYLKLKKQKEEMLIPSIISLNAEIEELGNELKQSSTRFEEIKAKYDAKVKKKNLLLLEHHNVLNNDNDYVNLSKQINEIAIILEENKKDCSRK